ncbi:maleylpyruvate isomerase family mycothiol-dependent enzyme [Glycomyces scopariae]|uniref:TIGR03083 family protein n=1 Tax=Glycomyces sambucus TaxID=380244 RepID=A0A1G9CSQ9_9ACTN|nr:maleylpyruvate isomerase family mycothiol-dependent enzyme [Glycomyces sambucus]SDK54444.1 TIGR03083 family protein [Glycomyces sambucus]
METSAYLDGVVGQTREFADLVDGKDAAAPVPTCPKWNLFDLVDHVGSVQRMVTMLVDDRMSEPSDAFARYVPAPSDSTLWRDWLNEGAAEAQRAFRSVSDDTPVWDPSGAAAGVPFWSRRLFGEICVHGADGAAALGTDYRLRPDYAAEAIEDWLDTLTSEGYWENRPDFADGMRGDGQTLHFHADDADGEWLARREQDRVALERTHGEADLTMSGPASDLLLVISRRRPLAAAPSLEIAGDRALLDRWIEHMDWVTD